MPQSRKSFPLTNDRATLPIVINKKENRGLVKWTPHHTTIEMNKTNNYFILSVSGDSIRVKMQMDEEGFPRRALSSKMTTRIGIIK